MATRRPMTERPRVLVLQPRTLAEVDGASAERIGLAPRTWLALEALWSGARPREEVPPPT